MTGAGRRMVPWVAALVLAVGLGGCAIHQRVDAVARPGTRAICIVENPDVRSGFLSSYRHALADKGYEVTVLARLSLPTACPLTSTYTANWRWDLALYMAFADVVVYADGQRVGRATYDSLGGGGNLGKFIDADTKIRELVEQLFPDPAPRP